MKTFDVVQFRFNKGQTRKVDIENTDDILNDVFHFGQNDFQPKDSPSVSVGDIIIVGDEKHIVKNFGFEKITDEFFNELKELVKEVTDKTFDTTFRGLAMKKFGDKGFDLFF